MGERFVYEKFPVINGDPDEIQTCAEPNEPKEIPNTENANKQNAEATD